VKLYATLWDRLCANIVIDELGCWIWIGPTRRHGGGDRPMITMRVAGGGRATQPKNYNAARIMCEQVHGPAPGPEYDASHLCEDEWLCICPDHVIWETKKENAARLTAKRRLEAFCDPFVRGVVTTVCPF
jgi:hypothetical protein